MKVIRTVVVVDRGNIIGSDEWSKIHSAYCEAIRGMVHPPGATDFVLRRKTPKTNSIGKRTSQWNRNGVTPIKKLFLEEMQKRKWALEEPLRLKDEAAQYAVTLRSCF